MVKIFLDAKYEQKELNLQDNLLLIYGENKSGKSKFLSDLLDLSKYKKKRVFDQQNFDDNREVVFISEDWDLKKEISLGKSSDLRKTILKKLVDKLEINDYDLFSELNQNQIINYLLVEFSKIIDVDLEGYKITPKLSFKNDVELIEKLFKLKIVDQKDNEINESIIAKSVKAQLFIKLLVDINAKNKIFLFDSPETFLDYNEQLKFWDFLKNLSKENLVICTFRNPNFLRANDRLPRDLYYFRNGQILQLKTTKQFLLNFYLLNKFDEYKRIKEFSDFEQRLSRVESVFEDEDYQIILQKWFKHFLIDFLFYFDANKNHLMNLEFVQEETEMFKYFLYAKSNFIEVSKFNFKTKWLDLYYQRLI